MEALHAEVKQGLGGRIVAVALIVEVVQQGMNLSVQLRDRTVNRVVKTLQAGVAKRLLGRVGAVDDLVVGV